MSKFYIKNLIAGSLLTLFGSVLFAAEPVDITYGYHPYWTGGWNGVIIKTQRVTQKVSARR